jgi:hypothetical protein
VTEVRREMLMRATDDSLSLSSVPSYFVKAWKEQEVAVYLDQSDCKWVARGGTLAWRISNPGLISSRDRLARKHGAIGRWDKFAIFPTPLQGRHALEAWLLSRPDLQAVARHYQPPNLEAWLDSLAQACKATPATPIKDLSPDAFETLAASVEDLCEFCKRGDEEFYLLPRPSARIEYSGENFIYLVGNNQLLTPSEAIKWVAQHRLDAVVAKHGRGKLYVRSRRRYRMQSLKIPPEAYDQIVEEPPVLARVVGVKTPGQPIWAFINGILNNKSQAFASAEGISKLADKQQVMFLPNDYYRFIQNIAEVLVVKFTAEVPIVKAAVKFFRYLLSLSATEGGAAVIIFAHSAGAAIAERALLCLDDEEKSKLRIFTLGGWSFVAQGSCHPDSHNFVSRRDLVPRVGSSVHLYAAWRRHEGRKEGLGDLEIMRSLAFEDMTRDLDSFRQDVMEEYFRQRLQWYMHVFEEIHNVTVLDSPKMIEHLLCCDTYQAVLHSIIKKFIFSEVSIPKLPVKNYQKEILV